jgi:hypothetical protein
MLNFGSFPADLFTGSEVRLMQLKAAMASIGAPLQ